ncbi:hypothetical protein G6L28_01905 [Agrobacterium larrymoorei]|uniref:hypothetical protein n=1 Tax=Agrobacterium larrymoorei TaxID=160699 RepID=UPI001574E919|nr:hypothetical protein [Agrobacterium larrymoorei]NTJ41351.1 hypothetical protein [Agrobacterium larrymoorei]
MSQPLARYLKDFSQFIPPEEPGASTSADFPSADFDSDWLSEPEEAVDLEEEKRKAFSEGEEAGRQAAGNMHAEELERLRVLHADELSRMKARYEEEIAGHLATSVISMKQMISQQVDTVCVRLFVSITEEQLARKAAADLAAQIIREIEGGFAGIIKVQGPETLISTMRMKLEGVENPIDYDVTNDIDIQVQLDNSVMMTRLSEFFQSIRGLADE